MKIFQKEIKVRTKGANDFIDITEKIEEIVRETKVKNGIAALNSLHNTACLIIQENDGTIFEDMKKLFDKILPLNEKYSHSYEGSLNATAHLKSNLLSQSITLPIKNGNLVLGTWQRIIFVELFEPRERTVFVTILGE
ncbi:MAG: secondary thiamine-phosphate synthase enzyme YjbQ [Candidatus Aenigmarchaeota archaeon]|nr:secondary thiamine-phosphate synthase enzyme YjbQ [Candidatus Aenigmarchaeota archaeon]